MAENNQKQATLKLVGYSALIKKHRIKIIPNWHTSWVTTSGIHRFLIHNILARRGFTPEGIMFPVSAAMLKNNIDYDASLEAFSASLIPLIEYSLNDVGTMEVHNETAVWYKYIDLTSQAEALYTFIEQAIDVELTEELTILINYDKTKTAIQEIIDMPDRQIDLFITFCLQNHGQLATGKRSDHFEFLTDNEVSGMEQAVQSSYGKDYNLQP